MAKTKTNAGTSRKGIVVVAVVIGALLLGYMCSHCGTPSGEEKADIANLLWNAGVDPSTLEIDGNDATIELETSEAIDFKDELATKWGRIFGILQGYADDEVIIINTVEGEPVATVAASVEDIQAFVHGGLTREQFLDKIEVKAE
jgi:hypothetical protein